MESTARMHLIDKLGFTPTEASVYLCLVRGHPQTGYKISSAIGKSRSSTYQALKSLENKQAILQLEGTRFGEYIPVSMDEYMAHKEKEFRAQKAEIIDAFKDIVPEASQESIYRITNLEQLYHRVQMMIEESKSIILVDTDDTPLGIIEEWIKKRANEGVRVMIETPGLKKRDYCLHIDLQEITPKDVEWNADWLCLSVDGEQFLISLLDKDSGELIHGLWCGDPFISPWVYNGMLHEFSFRVVMQMLGKETNREAVLQSIKEFTDRFFQPVSGFIRLQDKLTSRRPWND